MKYTHLSMSIRYALYGNAADIYYRHSKASELAPEFQPQESIYEGCRDPGKRG